MKKAKPSHGGNGFGFKNMLFARLFHSEKKTKKSPHAPRTFDNYNLHKIASVII